MVLKDFPIFYKANVDLLQNSYRTRLCFFYIDEILLLSNSKEHRFQNMEQLQHISTKNNLKLAPEKPFFMLLKINFPGLEIGYYTIKPFHSKIAAIHKILPPNGKIALRSFIGALKFFNKFIEKLHINLKPFYDLLHENTPWKWTDKHETFLKKLKMSLLQQNVQYQIQNIHFFYSRRFAYWIKRCSFPIERKKNESYILQFSYTKPTRTKTFHA